MVLCRFVYARETTRLWRAVMHASVSVEYECLCLLKKHTFTQISFPFFEFDTKIINFAFVAPPNSL